MAIRDYLPFAGNSNLTLTKLEAPPLERKSNGAQGYNLLSLPLALSRRLSGADVSMREAVAHELVFRCLEKIVDVAQDAIPTVERKAAKEWKVDEGHPLTRQLMMPNEEQGWPEFFKQLLIEEHVWGRWYVEVLRSSSKGVAGFRVIDTRWITEVGEYGQGGYLYDLWNDSLNIGRIRTYVVDDTVRQREVRPENMITFRLFDRFSVMAGLSAVRVALSSVGVGASVDRFADRYLTNGGPKGVLTFKNRTLQTEEAQAIQSKWRVTYGSGGTNEGGIAVLDEDGTYQPISGDLDEIAADELKQHTGAGICTAMGVPAILVGAYVGLRWSNQRAGQEGALRDFWKLKMGPLIKRYGHLFSRYFLAQYEDPVLIGTRMRSGWDLSGSSAAKEDMDVVANRTVKLYASNVIKQNEARQDTGYDPVEGGDKFKDERAAEMMAQRQASQPNNNQNDNQDLGKSLDSGRDNIPQNYQAKAYDWNGLKLSRKPTEIEEKQLPAIAAAQDSARAALSNVLSHIRARLITDALASLLASDNTDNLKLRLTDSEKTDLRLALEQAYSAGVNTARSDAKTQSKGLLARVKQMVKAVSAALVARVTGRVVDEYSRATLRGLDQVTALKQVEEILADEPAAYVEELASGAAYQAVGDGRLDELVAMMSPGDRFIQSGILDRNLCKRCKEDDLMEADDPRRLPGAPHPRCEGRWRCRCSIVIARD